MELADRYLPMGVLDENLNLSDVDESLITEYMGSSWYKGEETLTAPYFVTEPEYTEYNVEDRYTWVKCPAYDGKPYEAGGLARILAAYKRNVPFIVEQVDGLLEALGAPGQIGVAQSTLGRTAVRQVETLYIAGLMKEWVDELIEAVKSGDSEYFPQARDHHRRGQRLLGSPARRALPLGEREGRQDRGLPDHHPVHMEPRSG